MSFKDKRGKFDSLLNSKGGADNTKKKMDVLPLKVNKKKKQVTFSLYEITSKRITEIAAKQGYNSKSEFLDDLFESIYENM
ncbi:hypothetical protein [Dolosigranulum pigrum]|jgi:hypothetical protein|uniref:CopG family transcriptional regulator n=1 Tax=Dolosigranulum pigrum TaxID=29394 RepID=A0A516GHL8_9LACT|nr:hypothetical protein [Dolosigranulum pigrum]QDO91021.1 hypothetical protein FNV33_02770 [Dolosigranulum pigrum]QTJ37702.1 hypothetical protein FE324_02520 [Dolosigranulum pigrum]QTJ45591.1 hypothetical protein FE328_08640 [Dolosigranulum pigrum]